MQNISADAYIEPFPHLVFHNFYTNEELDLIWEELNFYTRPKKLFDVEDYQGVVGYTKAKALHLDSVYTGKNRVLSNILEVSRKVLDKQVLEPFSKLDDCCTLAKSANYDVTKVRYYHNGDFYKPHTDTFFEFLAFSYFYKEPKKFDGGNLIFPKYDLRPESHSEQVQVKIRIDLYLNLVTSLSLIKMNRKFCDHKGSCKIVSKLFLNFVPSKKTFSWV